MSLNEFVVPDVGHCFRFDPDLSLWKAINRKQRDFLATSDAKENSLLIGQQEWTIHNDSKSCSASTSYTRVLKLTGCNEEEFTCNDGNCVPMTSRCNGKKREISKNIYLEKTQKDKAK